MKRVRDQFGLAADIRPATPKAPLKMKLVLHELRRWQAIDRPFRNYRELGEAVSLSEFDVKRAIAWLEVEGLVDDRREPT